METTGTTVGAPKPEVDCDRLLTRLHEVAKRLEDRVVRLNGVVTRLYPQPRDEKPNKQARGEGWVEDSDGILDDIDTLVGDLGTELDLLNRFME